MKKKQNVLIMLIVIVTCTLSIIYGINNLVFENTSQKTMIMENIIENATCNESCNYINQYATELIILIGTIILIIGLRVIKKLFSNEMKTQSSN